MKEFKDIHLAEQRNPIDYKVCRCSLQPEPLGLEGFDVGECYLFIDYGSVASVFLPRLDYIDRLKRLEIREVGTVRLLDFRAFFVTTGKTGEDYV